MNEKAHLAIIYCIIALCVSGCATKPVGTSDITELAVSSERAISGIESINRELKIYQQQSRYEIDRLASASGRLEDTIQGVFGLSYQLCDRIDELTKQLDALTEELSQRKAGSINTGADTGNPLPD